MPGLVLALGVLPAVGLPQQQPPTFSADVDLVRIDVVVLDQDGRPITGLTAADFEITEKERVLDIASFEPVVVHPPTADRAGGPAVTTRISEPISAVIDENRYFLVYFDDVHVQAENSGRVRSHLSRFLERETREGDWVTIMAPLAGLRFTARTNEERGALPTVVHTLKGQLVRQALGEPSDFQAMQIEEYGSPAEIAARTQRGRFSTFQPSLSLLAAETYAIAKRRIRQSLTGVADAVSSLSSFRGRKALILYSEGFVKSPSLPDYDNVVEAARRAHVAIYTVDPRGLTLATGPAELDTAAGGSSYVALATGGRVSASNDLAAPLREAALESSAYYLLGFEPPDDIAGEHRFEVRVRREGATVRTTDRYILGGADGRQDEPPAIEAIGHVSDAVDIPFRVSTLFLGPARRGGVETTLAVEVDRAVDETRRLDLLIEARPGGPGLAVRDSAELTLPRGEGRSVATRELDLAPGLWQARVVVRDVETNRLGSVLHTFEVPDPSGLRVSTPILSAELESLGAPEPRLRLDRRYPPDGMLYCLFHVFEAPTEGATRTPRVRAGYLVTHGDQVVLASAPSLIEPTREGELMRLIGFDLSSWEPGDYVLTLGIFDDVGGEEREVREPFRVLARGR